MRSKSRWAFLSAVLLLALAGCLRIGEDRVSSGTLGMGGDTKCLSGGARTVAEYFHGEADEARISALWDCASRSLTLFAERTRGETEGKWSASELKTFLERYFVRDTLSPGFMSELMEIKRAIIGGDAKMLTRQEIAQAIRFVEALKTISLELRPYLPLSQIRVAQLDEVSLQRISFVIQHVSRELAQAIRAGGADYEFSHLEALLGELEQIAVTPSAQEHFRSTRAMIPMLRELKAILISPDSSRITSHDWEPLLSGGSQWFSLYLRWIHATAQSQSFAYGRGREQLMDMMDEGVRYLRRALSARPGNLITFEELDRLVDALSPEILEVQGQRIDPAHLKAFLRPLLRRALGGTDQSTEGRLASGLTVSGLRRLYSLAREWADGQRFIDRSFALLDGSPGEEVPEEALAPPGFKRSEILGLSVSSVLGEPSRRVTPAARAAAERVRMIVRTRRPLFNGPDMEIRLDQETPDPRYSHKALSMLNVADFLARLLSEAYSETEEDRKSGITLAEFTRFYWDVRDLGVDLLVLDRDNTSLFPKRFAEANLFLASSDGDERMGIEETAEMLGFSISAKTAGARNRDRIGAICNRSEPKPIPVDAFHAETIDPECYRRVFYESIEESWQHLPKLVSYFKSLDAAQSAEFIRNYELAARGITSNRVNTSDSEAYAGLAQYVESIFDRFDQDRSGTINVGEALGGPDPAYPVYENVLKKATCKLGKCLENQSLLEAVFTYLLANGKVPSGGELALWIIKRPVWSFEADRGRLIAVLASLSQASSVSDTASRSAAAFSGAEATHSDWTSLKRAAPRAP